MIKLKSPAFALIGTAALYLGIVVSAVLGYWNTESTKEPAKIRDGDFAGMPSPSDIRGSYTWNDIEKAFGVPASLLMEAFGSPSAELKVNTLEAAWAGKLPEGSEIGTDSVRLFVSLYTGLPHEAEAGTLLPAGAIEVLESSGKVDPAALAPYAPGIGAEKVAEGPSPSTKASDKPAEHATEPGSLGGTTTFGELKSWGASVENIKAALGGKIGEDGEVIKDFCSANGIKFGEVKTKLQALLEQ